MKKNSKWRFLKERIEYLTKLKKILNISYEIIFDLNQHKLFFLEKINLVKSEYFILSTNIKILLDKIKDIDKLININSINFFTITDLNDNLSNIIEILINIIYFLEKYGCINIINSINSYFTLISGIQLIYKIHKKYSKLYKNDNSNQDSYYYSPLNNFNFKLDNLINTDNIINRNKIKNKSKQKKRKNNSDSNNEDNDNIKSKNEKNEDEESKNEENEDEDSENEENEDEESENEENEDEDVDNEDSDNIKSENKENEDEVSENEENEDKESENEENEDEESENEENEDDDEQSEDEERECDESTDKKSCKKDDKNTKEQDNEESEENNDEQEIDNINNKISSKKAKLKNKNNIELGNNDNNIYNIHNYQKILNEIYSIYLDKKNTLKKKINFLEVLPLNINKKIINNNVNNYEFLYILNKSVIPIQINTFVLSENNNNYLLSSIYTSLNYFQEVGLIKNKNIVLINNIVDNIYKKYIIDYNIYDKSISTFNFDNPLLNLNINNFDSISKKIINFNINLTFNKKIKLIFIYTGYINNQDVIICHKFNFFKDKYINLVNKIRNIKNLPLNFKNNIVDIISLKQIFCSDEFELINLCKEYYSLYNSLNNMSILESMNYFLNKNKETKLKILISLLLNFENNEAKFKIYILWDLIMDESNFNKNNSIEQELFNNLHINLQIKLKHILNINFKKEKDINIIDENELDYERKIIIWEADDYVKKKALEKLKEIQNKNGDNTSKPLQYLDGLLKIPFNKYMKEWIIQLSDNLIDNSKIYLTNFIIYLYENKSKYNSYKDFLDIISIKLKLNIIGILNKLYNNKDSINESNSNNTDSNLDSNLDNNTDNTLDNNSDNTLNNNIELDTIYSPGFSNNLSNEHIYLLSNFNKFDQIINLIKTNKIKTYILREIHEEINNNIKEKINIDKLSNDNLKNIIKTISKEKIKELKYLLNTVYNVQKINYKSNNKIIEQILKYYNNNEILKKYINQFLIDNNYFYKNSYENILIDYLDKINDYLKEFSQLKCNKNNFLIDCYKRLNKSIYGQNDAKNQLIRIIAQWINGNQNGYCLGFEGSPGLGKTSLAKFGISKALKNKDGKSRPFGFIALGGSTNGSTLEGHSYTYVGSTWGQIVEILMNSKCMNPIIFIDELDKISNTDNGKEIIGLLTHITDRTQNNEFNDKYFNGINIDLSKVLFIFSYNDFSLIDRILADRIHRIKFENYSLNDKLIICKDYLIPDIENEININDKKVIFNDEVIKYLINSYTYEAGVRKLKEKLYDIFRELNVRNIKNELDLSILNNTNSNNNNNKNNKNLNNKNLKKKKDTNKLDDTLENNLDNNLDNNDFIYVNNNLIDEILDVNQQIEVTRPYKNNRVGVVYGLYATSMGIGGITIIQVSKKLIDISNTLLCTGKQGDVMLESMKVSLTLACNLVPEDILINNGFINKPNDKKSNVSEKKDDSKNNDSKNEKQCDSDVSKNILNKYSFHVHCPDGATPKDGPSAGCAITLGLISLLTNIKIKNSISMTGEIDVYGNVLPIGGLDSKISGSKHAGINTVLVPKKNEKDLNKIKVKKPEILEGMKIIIVNTVQDVLSYGLVKNNIKFNYNFS